MIETEFRATLPDATECGSCRKALDGLEWAASPYHGEWMGICIVRCDCGWTKIAAAGSSDDAHKTAQSIRSRLMRSIGK